MQNEKSFLGLRNLMVMTLMLAVVASTSLFVSATPENKVSMGELIVSGSSADGAAYAMLNGEKALSGRTFFSSGTIATTDSNSATVKMADLGSVEIAPNSSLSLSFGENSINATLVSGSVNVLNNAGVNVVVKNSAGAELGGSNGLYNASGAKQDDDDGKVSDGSQAALIAVFAGAVGGTILYLLLRDTGPEVGTNVSPVR